MMMFENINIPAVLAVTMFFLSIGAVFSKTGAPDE
jgi:hypothetical protein|tara:strand:- start:298 stop:402 length:105 start_codon:yes stop_codon:yes gene_type:complete